MTWQWAMQGYAACNAVLVVAANRIGNGDWDELTIRFYGPSFISDQRGYIVVQASRAVEEVVAASFDCKVLREERAAWGFFRGRRPYTTLAVPLAGFARVLSAGKPAQDPVGDETGRGRAIQAIIDYPAQTAFPYRVNADRDRHAGPQ